MRVAGVGCRRGCPADAIIAVVELAVRALGVGVEVLAAPEFKRDEAGLHEAAGRLGLPLVFVRDEALAGVQGLCLTRSEVVWRAVGVGSVAEAAALVVSGGGLLLPRVGRGVATCAIAGVL